MCETNKSYSLRYRRCFLRLIRQSPMESCIHWNNTFNILYLSYRVYSQIFFTPPHQSIKRRQHETWRCRGVRVHAQQTMAHRRVIGDIPHASIVSDRDCSSFASRRQRACEECQLNQLLVSSSTKRHARRTNRLLATILFHNPVRSLSQIIS